jgi:hypothetical protein
MSNKFSSLLDLLITINNLLEAMLELYAYFLYYLKKRKNSDGMKDVIRYLRKLNNKSPVH